MHRTISLNAGTVQLLVQNNNKKINITKKKQSKTKETNNIKVTVVNPSLLAALSALFL